MMRETERKYYYGGDGEDDDKNSWVRMMKMMMQTMANTTKSDFDMYDRNKDGSTLHDNC